MTKIKLAIIFTVLMDIIGIGIVIPVLPYFASSFGATPTIITLLFAVYALCSFFSAPLLGALSDKIGRKPILLISIFSTAIGWLVFASAHSILFLFIGRIIDGLAAGNLPIAQSYLVDISKTDKERLSNMGLIGSMFGLGFVIGPMLGGLLSGFSHALPFWVAGFLALTNLVIAWFFLPETNLNLDHHKIVKINPLLPIIKALKNKKLLPSYSVWLLFNLAAASTQAVFALYIASAFGLGASAAGFFMAGVGVLIIFNQGFLIRKVWVKKIGEKSLNVGLLLAYGFSFVLMMIPSLTLYVLAMLIGTIAQSTLRAVINSEIAGTAEQHEKGEVMGILASVASLAMIIGPMIAGVIYEVTIIAPFILSIFFMVLALIIVLIKIENKPIKVEPMPEEELSY